MTKIENSLLCQCYNFDFYVKSIIIHISQTSTDEISHKIDLLIMVRSNAGFKYVVKPA